MILRFVFSNNIKIIFNYFKIEEIESKYQDENDSTMIIGNIDKYYFEFLN